MTPLRSFASTLAHKQPKKALGFKKAQPYRSRRGAAPAIVDTQRWPSLKDVPTMPELGYPGMTMVAFSGLFAPAGTDKAIVETINQAVNDSLRTPEAKAVMESIAENMQLGSPADFQTFVNTESPKWRELVRISGAKAE